MVRDLEGELGKDQRQTCVALGQKPFPVAPQCALAGWGPRVVTPHRQARAAASHHPRETQQPCQGEPRASATTPRLLAPHLQQRQGSRCTSLGSSPAPDTRLSRTAGRPWEKQLDGSWAGSFSPGTPGSATIPAWSPPFTRPDIGMFAPDEHCWPHPSEPPRPCPGRWGLNLVCPRLWPSSLEPRTGAKSEYASVWGTPPS